MDGLKPLGFLEVMQKISSTFESLFIHQNQTVDAPTYSYNIIVVIRTIVQTFTCMCSIMIGTKNITCTMMCDHQAFCQYYHMHGDHRIRNAKYTARYTGYRIHKLIITDGDVASMSKIYFVHLGFN